MSSTLFWEPVKGPDNTLSTELKLLLREIYGFPVDIHFTQQNASELLALKAGRSSDTKNDVDQLLAAIEQHGVVRVFEGGW